MGRGCGWCKNELWAEGLARRVVVSQIAVMYEVFVEE